MNVMERIENLRLVPVAVAETAERAEEILMALTEGGLPVAEVTFRTACAAEAIRAGRRNHPDMLIGAGTVINAEQCRQAVAAGAQFIVSPGLSRSVAAECRKAGVPYLPGCATPTEIMAALEEGISIVKFFPASVYGGLKAIKAIGAAFPAVRFLPTGGVDASNLAEFAAESRIFAIGGSWMLKGSREEMTAKTAEAVKIIAQTPIGSGAGK